MTRSFLQRGALLLGAVFGLIGTRPATANAQKALVYCPVNVDATGCNAIVAALTGPAFPLGVHRGYDGTGGTVDLKAVDLFSYSVFVVPSLADGGASQPYAKLRDPEVAEHLKAALIGRIAMWSGTPDQGATNRMMKDALIQNLSGWAAAAYGTAKGPGLVALLDASSSAVTRYDWVRAITPVPVTSDASLLIYNEVRALNPRATTILTSGAGPIAYANMATFGFQLPNGAAGVSLDAVGQTGTPIGGQVVLLTMEAGNASGAVVRTDKDDYAPGETVTITGSGWQPGEQIKLSLHMDPARDSDTELTATADGSGNFTNTDFAPGAYDVGVRFVVTATGQVSGRRAQTTFTDGNRITFSSTAAGVAVTNFGTVALGACNPAFVQERQGVNIDNGNHAARVVNLSSSPATITFHNNNTCGGGANQITSVTIAANTPAIAFWFKINSGNGAFTLTGDAPNLNNTNDASATVSVVATNLTLAAPSPASVTYGSAGPVSLSATLTRVSPATAVVGATINFTVDGSPVGSAVTNGSGVATLPYNPSALPAGPHSVQAVFPGQTISGTTFSPNTSGTQTLTVTPKTVSPNITANNKTYDGTTAATIATRTLTGVVGADDVTLVGGTATFADKNVGVGKTVTATGLSLSGTTAGNYVLSPTTATTTATIFAVQLTVAITASNKVYDATTAATILTRTLSGVIGSEVVTVSGGTATFDNKNVGVGKTVTGTGFVLGGADAGNYVLSAAPVICTADITALGITGNFTAANKVYNGNTAATVLTRTLTGVIAPDVVTLTGGTATFDNKNVGTGKTVTLAGATLAGADAGNYTLLSVGTTTADITALAITGSITADNKVYDGTTAATILTRTLSGQVGGDAVSYVGGTATFDTKNIGTGKTVTATGLGLSGADAGNYTVNSTATTTADITPKALIGSITAANKVYDGNNSATILTRTLAGVIGSETVSYVGGTATFDTKNAGIGKTVTATGLSLSGADAGNYTVNTTATTTADITPLGITGNFTADNKVYDGTTSASVLTRTLNDVIGADDVSLTGGTATFDTKNVGTGKTVTLVGATLAGADAGNYTLLSVATTTANITALAITGSITADNKVYDGNTSATILTRTLSGQVAGDAVSYVGGTATFDTKNVGVGKTVTAIGLSLTGADAGNYTVNTTATTTADITPKTLTGSITAANKVYDGTTAATILTRTLLGVISGETVTYVGGAATFDNKNAGVGKTVTASGLSLSGADAGNYTVNSTASTTADITPLGITGNFTADNKTYDGTTSATVLTRTLNGVIAPDVVTLNGGTATFDTKNVGIGKTVTLVSATLAGVDAGNYALLSVGTATANITALAITGNITANNKVYDGNNTATIATRTLVGAIAGDDVDYSGGTATFDNKNVGTGKTVTATGLSLTGTDAGNYTVNTTATTTADITPKALTGSITAANKVYDATTAATILTRTLAGVIGGDVVNYVGGTATFDNKNVGTAKTVTATGLSLDGANAGNYTVNTTATTTANITALAITGAITAANKIYDGTIAASILTRTLTGVIAGDVVNYIGGTATFSDKNVGNGKTVTATGLSLDGADAGNYTVNATAATTANITPRTLTVSATGVNKVYDGTTAATVTLSDDRVSGDVFTASYTTATFADKNVGNGKAVSVTGISISGTDAGNYVLAATTANTTANITPLAITGTITADNKVYDGTNAATILTRTLSGQIASDDVSYTGGTATFDTKNVGNGKTVTATGLSLSGVDAGNYTVNSTATTTANITPLGITGNFTAANKTYDGTTAATVVNRTLNDVIAPDVVTLNGGTATFDTKSVGTGKTVTLAGATLAGADAGNYTLLSVGTTTADIIALAITGSITADNKVYDGTTAATILTRTLTGQVGGDAVSYVGGTATFDTKNIGTGKTVTATGLGLSGADAGNYTVNTTATTTADITPKALTGSVTAANKTYDGNNSATILTRTLAGVIASETVNYVGGAATFDNKNAGVGKTVTATGLSLTGADAGNYTVNTTATTTADITPLGITGNFTADNKVYDGTTNASVLTRTLNGVIAPDVVTLNGGTATFDTKNVGNGKTVTLAGATLAGGDATNYSLVSVATTTADITPLAITGSVTADNKIYDGNTSATILTRTLSGQVAGDAVSYVGGTATFADKVVGTGKTVTATGLSLTGADAGNYTVNTTATTIADITPKTLTGSITAANKVYDATTAASILSRTLAGVVSGDVVTYVGGTATFDNKNVGTGKTVTGIGLSITGADAGNYTVNSTATTTADITPLGITGSITAANKVYDGTTAATILTRTLAGVISGDVVAYDGGTGTFANKNVGNGKVVTGTGLGLTGADAGNYTVNTTATTTADITPATPTINWANPADIVWAAPLTATQLNATGSGVLSEVPAGTFAYTPTSGTVLVPGTHSLAVQFTSGDLNYTNASKNVSITVLDQTKPLVSNSIANPNPVQVGTPFVTLAATISDATTGGSKITSACFRVDGGTCMPVNAFTAAVTVSVTANVPLPSATDVIEVCAYGTDAAGNTSIKMDCVLVAIYDPTGGFVTGGGWINSPMGAYVANPSLTGKATFGFVSKYKKGQSTPDGNTEFQFHAAGFNFKSTSYEWLVIAGSKAQYKGSGTINGSGDYFFMLTATDSELKGKPNQDTFRMKVWNKTTLQVIYDNQIGLSDTDDPTTLLGGGSIQIHAK